MYCITNKFKIYIRISLKKEIIFAMISLILIYGPPGVGKTTLKQNLSEHISSNSKNNSSICLSISYDELIDKNLENMIINESNEQQQQQQAWKESRSFILKLITLLIDYLKQQEKQEKNYYFNILDDKERTSSSLYLKIIQDKFNNLMFSLLNTNAIRHENFYILLDDLFYYSSMRLSFYRLACSKQCSYFSIGLIASNINILLERNETRSHSQRLSIHIIENIFKKLETNKNNWEFNFTHLIEINNNNQNLTDLFDLIEIGLNKFQIYLQNQQTKEEEEETKQQQQQSENNLIHECDLKLRKLISLKLTNSEDKKNLAFKLNLLKSNILSELKTKQIKLDHLSELEIENYLNEKLSS